MSIETSFAKLLGRQPTDAERVRLYRVKDALGLGDNDALWLVVMALEHDLTLFEGIPEKIAQASVAAQREIEAHSAHAIEVGKLELGKTLGAIAAESKAELNRLLAEAKRANAQDLAASKAELARAFAAAARDLARQRETAPRWQGIAAGLLAALVLVLLGGAFLIQRNLEREREPASLVEEPPTAPAPTPAKKKEAPR